MASVFHDLVRKKKDAFRLKYSHFNSAHEALAVMWEEFEELKKEVFRRKRIKDRFRFMNELVDIAAYAEIFAEDVQDFVPDRNHMPIPKSRHCKAGKKHGDRKR